MENPAAGYIHYYSAYPMSNRLVEYFNSAQCRRRALKASSHPDHWIEMVLLAPYISQLRGTIIISSNSSWGFYFQIDFFQTRLLYETMLLIEARLILGTCIMNLAG